MTRSLRVSSAARMRAAGPGTAGRADRPAHARGATIAGSGPSLPLSAGMTLLAEGRVVAHRATITFGGQSVAGSGNRTARRVALRNHRC